MNRTRDDEGVVLTRRQLYERVWMTPMRVLGPELGLSDVGLRKICERLNIPTPRVGYWAKKQHGKATRRPELPTPPDPDESAIEFFPRGGTDSDATAVAVPPGPRPIVLDEITDAHPVVEATLHSLQSARPDSEGLVRPRAKGCLDVHVMPEHVDRAMRIMDALVKSIEGRGLPISAARRNGRPGTEITVDGEPIAICLQQGVQRRERDPTPDEARRLKIFGPKNKKFYHYVATDSLCLRVLSGPSTGSRHRFADSPTRRLETLLDSFVRALYRTAREVRDDRKHREEVQRQRESEAERQRRWEAQRTEKLREIAREEERVRELLENAERWRQAQNLRSFIDAVRRAMARVRGELTPDSPDARWIEWAEAQADRLDPMYESPASIIDEKPKWSSY